MLFSKKEHHYNGFLYKWYKSAGSINLATLTNFIPVVPFYSPWKYPESFDFQGVEKETTGMEWVNL